MSFFSPGIAINAHSSFTETRIKVSVVRDDRTSQRQLNSLVEIIADVFGFVAKLFVYVLPFYRYKYFVLIDHDLGLDTFMYPDSKRPTAN